MFLKEKCAWYSIFLGDKNVMFLFICKHHLSIMSIKILNNRIVINIEYCVIAAVNLFSENISLLTFFFLLLLMIIEKCKKTIKILPNRNDKLFFV